jgi:cytoplasmic iron level regulating protein YaaA (DUF328/UPF0246 family)
VAKKATTPLPAASLYRSAWFLKAHRFVTGQLRPGDLWFILSAAYGLVPPRKVLAPYNQTLATATKQERQIWSQKILKALDQVLEPTDSVVILAGVAYRSFLLPALRAKGIPIQIPMRGLSIGRQLRWLTAHSERRGGLF